MGCEIERKFLVLDDSWKASVTEKHHLIQGYASPAGKIGTIRFRVIDDERAYLTLKGHSHGIARSEFEYELPVSDVLEMLQKFGNGATIEKIRHIVPAGDFKWEIDEFLGENSGLVIAEIELPRTDAFFDRPAWLGKEVSGDRRFGNGFLSQMPFSRWGKEK